MKLNELGYKSKEEGDCLTKLRIRLTKHSAGWGYKQINGEEESFVAKPGIRLTKLSEWSCKRKLLVTYFYMLHTSLAKAMLGIASFS